MDRNNCNNERSVGMMGEVPADVFEKLEKISLSSFESDSEGLESERTECDADSLMSESPPDTQRTIGSFSGFESQLEGCESSTTVCSELPTDPISQACESDEHGIYGDARNLFQFEPFDEGDATTDATLAGISDDELTLHDDVTPDLHNFGDEQFDETTGQISQIDKTMHQGVVDANNKYSHEVFSEGDATTDATLDGLSESASAIFGAESSGVRYVQNSFSDDESEATEIISQIESKEKKVQSPRYSNAESRNPYQFQAFSEGTECTTDATLSGLSQSESAIFGEDVTEVRYEARSVEENNQVQSFSPVASSPPDATEIPSLTHDDSSLTCDELDDNVVVICNKNEQAQQAGMTASDYAIVENQACIDYNNGVPNTSNSLEVQSTQTFTKEEYVSNTQNKLSTSWVELDALTENNVTDQNQAEAIELEEYTQPFITPEYGSQYQQPMLPESQLQCGQCIPNDCMYQLYNTTEMNSSQQYEQAPVFNPQPSNTNVAANTQYYYIDENGQSMIVQCSMPSFPIEHSMLEYEPVEKEKLTAAQVENSFIYPNTEDFQQVVPHPAALQESVETVQPEPVYPPVHPVCAPELEQSELQMDVDMYPYIYVSTAGILTVLMRESMTVEITLDHTIRVVDSERGAVMAINTDGSSSCIFARGITILQDQHILEAAFYKRRRVFMTPDEAHFAVEGLSYTMRGSELFKTENEFSDISGDLSMNILYASKGYGPKLIPNYLKIVEGAQYIKHRNGGITVFVDGLRIYQSPRSDMEIAHRDKFVRLSPQTGSLFLGSKWTDMAVEKGGVVRVRQDERYIYATREDFKVTCGQIECGVDHTLHAFINPVEIKAYELNPNRFLNDPTMPVFKRKFKRKTKRQGNSSLHLIHCDAQASGQSDV